MSMINTIVYNCDGCNLWIHQKCAGLTKKQYELLQKEGEDEPWYCRPCKKNMFPFFDLTNIQINNLQNLEQNLFNISS